jgi:RNA polymerase sigma-70 factor (ECF subfamily)
LDRSSDEFILLLTKAQSAIYACIFALHPDPVAAHDLLQETNLTLCKKASDFELGTNFTAWATRIARYHVLNYRRRLKREKTIFEPDLFEELCFVQEQRSDEIDRYLDAMRDCLRHLPSTHRQLLQERYTSNGSVSALASQQGKSVAAISQLLYRIRQSLMDCIYRKVQEANA